MKNVEIHFKKGYNYNRLKFWLYIKLYKNFLRAEELGVSIDKVPSKFSQTVQKGLIDLLECAGGLLLNP